MPENVTQTYKNHARLDPPFHFFVLPVALATVIITIIRLVHYFNFENCWLVVFSLAFLVMGFKTRLYPLQAQDRVIRLEERLRMERVLAEPLRTRSRELSERQLIALRFAPDAELPGLVEQTLANGWNGKQIKQAVREWRGDLFRV